MATTYPTLLDMAIRNGRDRAVPLIEETSKPVPEVSGKLMNGTSIPGVGSVRTIKGISYKTLVRTSNPTVNFRSANYPAKLSKSTYVNRNVETFIINPRWQADKAVADRSEDGPDQYMADEALAMTEATFQALGAQFYYGQTLGDAKGFYGLQEQVDAAYTTSAGGTAGGGSSGICSSVYYVKFGVGHVQWVYGENGLLSIPDRRTETIYIPDENGVTGPVTGYVQEMMLYPGLQVGSTRSVSRIKLITGETNKTLTDNLMATAEAKFLVQPDVCFMHPTLLEQLRQSRTSFNPDGKPASTPTVTIGGIPIAATRSLSLSEQS